MRVFVMILMVFLTVFGCDRNPETVNNRTIEIPTELFGKDTESFPVGKGKVIALTFDAGADNAGIKSILDTLAKTETSGTFFLTGNFVKKFPKDVKEIAKRHIIGNHTMSHPHMIKMGTDKVRFEIADGAKQIQATTGADQHPWFRFPFGEASPTLIAEANKQGFIAIRWSVDSLGWKGKEKGKRSADTVAKRVLSAARPGGIVLMHVGANPDDHSTLDADALPAIIDGLHNKGFKLVNLDEMLSYMK